jgi:thioredoxin 1
VAFVLNGFDEFSGAERKSVAAQNERKRWTMSKNVNEVQDATFEKDVLGSDKPVLVDFWAEWCAPCRMIAPTVDAVANDFEGRASVVKLNVDDNPATSQRYGIKGIPTLILFKNGQEAERIVGATSKDALTRLLEKHAPAKAVSA